MKNHKSSPERHVAIYGSHEGKSKRWELEGTEEELRKVLPLAIKHPPKKCFPRLAKNPYPNVVLGDWDTDIVKVDWDERFLCEVKRFCTKMGKINRSGH